MGFLGPVSKLATAGTRMQASFVGLGRWVRSEGEESAPVQSPSCDEQASAEVADSISLVFRLVRCGCDGGHLAAAPFLLPLLSSIFGLSCRSLTKGSEGSKRKYVNRGATENSHLIV